MTTPPHDTEDPMSDATRTADALADAAERAMRQARRRRRRPARTASPSTEPESASPTPRTGLSTPAKVGLTTLVVGLLTVGGAAATEHLVLRDRTDEEER